MKKIYQILMMLLMVSFCTVSTFVTKAEAAGIVLLPLINNVEVEDVEAAYYNSSVDSIKDQVKYEMVDNEQVTAAIEKYTVKGQIPNEDALRNIAEAADADLVVCMQLDKLSLDPVPFRTKEELYRLQIEGLAASYDRETNSYKCKKIYKDEEYDILQIVRVNAQLREWSRMVRHEMHRVMQVKGFKADKPRFQKPKL